MADADRILVINFGEPITTALYLTDIDRLEVLHGVN